MVPSMRGKRALGAVLVALLAAGCSSEGIPDEADVELSVKSPVFDTLDSLAIESDLIVRGTVTSVVRGRVVGEGQEATQYRDVSIRVEQVLLARQNTKPTSVVVQEMGWWPGPDGEEQSIEDPDLPWSKDGQRGYFFLEADIDAPGKFQFLGPQGRVLITEKGLASGGEHDLEPVERVNALSNSEFGSQVAAIATKIAKDDIPNPPGVLGHGGKS